jgi:hypothetical protein
MECGECCGEHASIFIGLALYWFAKYTQRIDLPMGRLKNHVFVVVASQIWGSIVATALVEQLNQPQQ